RSSIVKDTSSSDVLFGFVFPKAPYTRLLAGSSAYASLARASFCAAERTPRFFDCCSPIKQILSSGRLRLSDPSSPSIVIVRSLLFSIPNGSLLSTRTARLFHCLPVFILSPAVFLLSILVRHDMPPISCFYQTFSPRCRTRIFVRRCLIRRNPVTKNCTHAAKFIESRSVFDDRHRCRRLFLCTPHQLIRDGFVVQLCRRLCFSTVESEHVRHFRFIIGEISRSCRQKQFLHLAVR